MKFRTKTVVGRCLSFALVAVLSTQAWAIGQSMNEVSQGSESNQPTDIPTALENADWKEISANSGELEAGNYYLTDDVILTGANLSIVDSATVNLHLNGCTLKGVENFTGTFGSVITIEEGETLNLYDNTSNTGKITGGVGKYDNGGGVYVDGGTFNMYGGTIANNTVSAYGGGVYVNGGSFTMEGGNITENKAKQNGGGVYVNYATFEMQAGNISSNVADSDGDNNGDGGGLYLNSAKSVTINSEDEKTFSNNKAANAGGIFVSNEEESGANDITINKITLSENGATNNNKSLETDSNGGGLYVTDLVMFTLTNSTIEKNTTLSKGAGMFLSVDNIKMTDNTITDNQMENNEGTGNNGGGVYITRAKTIEMTTNTILRNHAYEGAGLHLNMCEKATLNGNTFSDNVTHGYSTVDIKGGAGAYVDATAFSMTDDTFTGNKSAGAGAGLYVKKPTAFDSETYLPIDECVFTMTNVTIGGVNSDDGNTAVQNGGGIYAIDAKITMTDSNLQKNHSDNMGGGICIKNCKFAMTGSTIQNNTNGSQGAGLCAEEQNNINITGSTITGNQSKNNGGGVYIQNVSTVYMEDSSVTNNTADVSGGGIVQSALGTKFTFSGKITVTGNTADGASNNVVLTADRCATIPEGKNWMKHLKFGSPIATTTKVRTILSSPLRLMQRQVRTVFSRIPLFIR